MEKLIKLGDLFTHEQVKEMFNLFRASKLGGPPAYQTVAEYLKPQIAEISRKAGTAIDPMYMALCVDAAFEECLQAAAEGRPVDARVIDYGGTDTVN